MVPQKHKLSRKELKQDGFVDWTGRAYEYVQANYLKLAIGVVALVVVVLAVAFYLQGQERGRQRASELLFQGQALLAAGNYAAAVEPLQQAVDNHGGSELGKRAHLDLAHALLGAGQREQALQVARDGLERIDSADAELHQGMLMVEAAVLSSLERWEDAIVVYRGLLAQDLPAPLRIDASFRLAEALKLRGDVEGAVTVLEELESAVARGDVPGPVRELTDRLSVYRALASR